MRRVGLTTVLAIAIVSFAAMPARAATITYEFSGTASGTIGGMPFTDASLLFTGTADTTNVETFTLFGATFFAVALDSLTLTIPDIGTVTMLDATEVFGIPQVFVDPEGEIPPIPLVILGRIDNPPDLTSFTGIAGAGSNDLAGYNLKTSIGPVGDSGFGSVGFFPECGIMDTTPAWKPRWAR